VTKIKPPKRGNVEIKLIVKWTRDHPDALDTSASSTLKMNDSEKKKVLRE
jgi:hypothetical protein